MPIFEYECERCHRVFELKLPMEQFAKMQECPKCTGRARRIPSRLGYRYDHTVK